MTGLDRGPVLIVVDDMNAGGMERQVVELLKGLRRTVRRPAGLAVIKPGGQRLAEAREEAAHSLVTGYGGRASIVPAALEIRRFAGSIGAACLVGFGLLSGFAGLLAARLARLPVANASIRSAPLRLAPKDRLSRILMRSADMVIANSRAGLKSFGFGNSPRSRVIPNGMDLSRFDGAAPGGERTWDVCMVGNFWAKKDHRTLVEAFRTVRMSVPEARMVLVGRDWGTLESCRGYAAELGLGGAVDYVTDCLDPSPMIASSRVCALLSPDGEGISNAILEYMALGKAVVATRCDGNAESMEDRVTGLLVENEPGQVAEALVGLLGDPGTASAMGSAGRKRVAELFTLDRMVESFEQAFEDLEGIGRR